MRILQSSDSPKRERFLAKANHCSLSRPIRPRSNMIVVRFFAPWVQQKIIFRMRGRIAIIPNVLLIIVGSRQNGCARGLT